MKNIKNLLIKRISIIWVIIIQKVKPIRFWLIGIILTDSEKCLIIHSMDNHGEYLIRDAIQNRDSDYYKALYDVSEVNLFKRYMDFRSIFSSELYK